MIRRLALTLLALWLVALACLAVAPPASAQPVRDGSHISGTTLRKCVSTTYRAKAWHTHKTRAGERCLWTGYWYPASWVVLDEPAYYGGTWWPVMQAPPRGGWRGHKPADATWWPGRAVALQRFR